jgi:hypothetical protein
LDKASKISNVVTVGDGLPDVKPELFAELQFQPDVSVHYFQVLCILEDIHSISKHVEEVWREQKRGHVDSVVASVITEMAFQVFQELEQSWPPIIIPSDHPRRPVQDAHLFWLQTCDHDGQPQEYTKSHPLKEKSYMTGVPSIPIFQFFLQGFPNVFPTDPILDGELESNDHDHDFYIAAMRICTDGMISGMFNLPLLIRDSLTKDIQKLRWSRRSVHDSSVDPIEFHNLSTVFSLQLLANVHKILGGDIGKATELMRIRLK